MLGGNFWHHRIMMETNLTLRDNVAWVDKHCLIHAVYHGDQTPDKIRQTFADIEALCEEMAAKNEPILLLWDIRDVDDFPIESRFIALRARAELPFWRLAIVTSSDDGHLATNISQRLTAMSGRKKEIDYFTALSEAYYWLDAVAARYRSIANDWPVFPS